MLQSVMASPLSSVREHSDFIYCTGKRIKLLVAQYNVLVQA